MGAAVQRIGKGLNGASVSIGSTDGWATPTAGNLLVISANSDALVTLNSPTGVSVGPSVVDGNGTYTWYKTAAGTESTITATPSASDHITVTACEYSGFLTFDASNSSTVAGAAGLTTTAAAVTTTAAADLIVGFALLHSYGGAQPVSASWSNSFVQVLSANSGSPVNAATTTFVGELLPAGAAGSYSTVCTWTTVQASDRQHIILAFKATAAAPAFVYPPRRRGPNYRR